MQEPKPVDDKSEEIALFRYGLIAPLVLEALPRGELSRRAEEMRRANTRFHFPAAAQFP